MRYTWERAFKDGREAALMGEEGPGRLLDACERLMPADATYASLGIEVPLLGKAGYDMLITFPNSLLAPEDLSHDAHADAIRGVYSWNAQLEGARPVLYVEVDHEKHGEVAGIHCKIEDRMDLAEGFFLAMGEPWRTDSCLQIAGRLPEGCICLYAAAFPGRGESATRMEILVLGRKARSSMTNAAFIGKCLDRIGFGACDGRMLEDMASLARIDAPLAFQLDILPDGTLEPSISLVTNYEHVKLAYRPLFEDTGALAQACRVYEEMGIADKRWELLRECCFASKRTLLCDAGMMEMACISLPNCTKVKWHRTKPLPARVYMHMEQRWL